MSIKPDNWIKRMALEHQMIDPFVDDQVRAGVISYGVSSYGYDVRVGDEFKVFTNVYNTVVDPKNFDSKSFVDIKAEVCIIPPNSFALASTIEESLAPHEIGLFVCPGAEIPRARAAVEAAGIPYRALDERAEVIPPGDKYAWPTSSGSAP